MGQYTAKTLEAINGLNLAEIVEASGVSLKKTGKSWMGLCPFHNDKNPSLSVMQEGNKWFWKCFGCGQKGNVIKYVMAKEQRGFIETVEYLAQRYGGVVRADAGGERVFAGASGAGCSAGVAGTAVCSRPSVENVVGAGLRPCPSYELRKLLDDVLKYYEAGFAKSQKAQGYLKERGITNHEIFEQFRIGYADGSLPKQRECVEQLRALGILGERDGEIFYDCVIFPIEDIDRNVTGIYGRRIGERQHRYLKGNHKGVFNARVFKAYQKIYLTEGIIDALSLYQVGIRETVALFGTNGLTQDHIRYMRDNLTKEIVLCFDNDEAGRLAQGKIAERLGRELGIRCYALHIPDGLKDVNDWLTRGMSREAVEAGVSEILIEGAVSPQADPAQAPEARPCKAITDVLEFSFNHSTPARKYVLSGIEWHQVRSLRSRVKVMVEKTGSHVDTIDMYTSIGRNRFAHGARQCLELPSEVVHGDFREMVEELERMQNDYLKDKKRPLINGVVPVTVQEQKAALELLKDARFLERVVEDFHECGYVGEDMNLLMGYIAASSRKLPSPLSMLVIARSAAGKTSLQDAVLSFIPEDEVIQYTKLTGQSLFYQDEDALYKKVLAIEEEAGANEAGYALRSVAMTGKSLRTGSTIKDPVSGKLKNQNTRVRLQTAVFITTTKQGLEYETANRFIIASVDESEAQTKRILEYQRKLYGALGHSLRERRKAVMRLHQNVQRLLGDVDVVNPYQEGLTFTTKTLRARREQIKYLGMINTIAYLRQHQKEKKTRNDGTVYVEADKADIALANSLARVYLARNMDFMSPPARNLYGEIRGMVQKQTKERGVMQNQCALSRRDIMEYTGWSEWQVREHTRELAELEYLVPVMGRQGKRYCYVLADDAHKSVPLIELGLAE